jgi:PAS domain S-box-containing protein
VSETQYRRLFETAQDGIFILDADTGRILDANPFLVEMLGYAHEVLVGKELWELGLFKDIEASKQAFAILQRNGYIRGMFGIRAHGELTINTYPEHTPNSVR